MKVALCLFAVLAVALARPQDGYVFIDTQDGPGLWPETEAIARQKLIIKPYEQLFDFREAPRYNIRLNVPYNEPLSVAEFVRPIDDPSVYPTLQQSLNRVLPISY